MPRWQRRLANVVSGGILGGGYLATTAPQCAMSAPADGRWAWCAGLSNADSDPAQSERIVASVREEARQRGLEITVGLTLQDYHAKVPPELALPTYGRRCTLAILLGSTRTIWPPFLAHLLKAPQLVEDEAHDGPLNAFVVRAAEEIVAKCVPSTVRCELFYAHEMEKGRLVAVQHAAHVAGVAFFHQKVGLCIHPCFGPWHSYRALLVLDVEGVPSAGPPLDPCLNTTEVAQAEEALKVALAATADPLATNSKLELQGSYKDAWRLWQRVRQSFVVGSEYQYEDVQDEYHYSWSKEALRRMLVEASGEKEGDKSTRQKSAGASFM